MKIITTIFLVFSSALLNANTIVTGVHVYADGKASFSKKQSIFIENGKITSVNSQLPSTLTADITIIECNGCYALPGIIEMHGHLPTRDFQSAEVEDLLTLFVTHGVTTVRSVLGGPGQMRLLKRIKNEKLLAPDLVMASPGFSGGNAKSANEAAARINQYAKQGWQLVKVYNGLSTDVYDAIINAAKSHNMPVVGHVPMAVGLEHVLNAGQQTIEHLDGYFEGSPAEYRLLNDNELSSLAEKTREANVGMVPTMKVWEVILKAVSLDDLLQQTPGLQYINSELVDTWQNNYSLSWADQGKAFIKKVLGEYDVDVLVENRRRLLGVMANEGVAIYFGTDSPQTFSVAGASVVAEMLEMQRSGMSQAQIIDSATIKPGKLLSPYFKVGQIKPGYEADLILLKEDPLKDLRAFENPAGVFINGVYLSEGAIREKLDAIKQRAAAGYAKQ